MVTLIPCWGKINPEAKPVKGVAIALAAALVAGACERKAQPLRRSMPVVLVTIETLRADRLGAYGHPGSITPALDRLARASTVFDEALAPSCFTAPSMASIATAQYPISHGVLGWGDRGSGMRGRTAAELLGDLGYRTAFLSAHGALGRIEAVTRGFDRIRDDPSLSAEALTEAALAWIDRSSRPFFLWLHYFDPHAPYAPPEVDGRRFLPPSLDDPLARVPYAAWLDPVPRGPDLEFDERVELLTALYEGEIACVDRAIGRLLEGLSERGLDEETLLVVTADHGENLDDHAPFFDHRDVLFDSLVRVPLLVRAPRKPAQVTLPDPGQVALMALLPTVLDLLGAAPPGEFQIGSFADRLAPSERRPAAGPPGPVFLDSGLQENPHKAVREGRWKLTLELRSRTYRLFDLEEDPQEISPREAGVPGSPAGALRTSLDAWLDTLRAARPSSEAPLSPAEIQRLRQLGYL